MKNFEGDCSDCPNRWYCDNLCEAARYFINTDYVYRTEIPMGDLLPPRQLPSHRSHPNLTPRELEILRFLVIGCTRGEIAQHLNITRNAVYFHISNMKKKYKNL